MAILTLGMNVALLTVPKESAAQSVRAYVLFELDESADRTTIGKLSSLSLGNCKQIPLEIPGNAELILHLECYEPDKNNRYMGQAVLDLAASGGVRRATVLAVK